MNVKANAGREATSPSSQFRLLAERRFGPFFGVQFLGAFNDNVFKQALVILLAYQTASFTTMSSDALQNVAQALFHRSFRALLGDRRPARGQVREIAAHHHHGRARARWSWRSARRGFFTHEPRSCFWLALFLGGVQSALFGPVKYAILPQQLQGDRADRRQRAGRERHFARGADSA